MADDKAPMKPEINKSAPGQIMPGVSDIEVSVRKAPDADYRPVALANAIVDSEAGAMPSDDDQGGIVPLKRKGEA